jgi:hypothetical protein
MESVVVRHDMYVFGGVVDQQHPVPAQELANRTVGKASLRKSEQNLGVKAIIAALRRDCQSQDRS